MSTSRFLRLGAPFVLSMPLVLAACGGGETAEVAASRLERPADLETDGAVEVASDGILGEASSPGGEPAPEPEAAEGNEPEPEPEGAEPADGSAALAEAVRRTAAVTSGRVSFSWELDAAEESMTYGSSATFDHGADRLQTSMELTGVVVAGLDEVNMEAIVDGDVLYMRGVVAEQIGVSPGMWLKADPSGGQALPPEAMGRLSELPGDPAALEAVMFTAGGAVEDLGPDDVDGASTRHYRTQIDPIALLDAMSAGNGVELANSSYEKPMDVWVDANGLIRRLVVDLDGDDVDASGQGVVRMRLDYTDLGQPIEIELPGEDEVTTAQEFVAQR